MKTNRKIKQAVSTAEGGKGNILSLKPENQLQRSVLSCMLWEKEFYEDGVSISNRIVASAQQVDRIFLAGLARQARGPYNLRHVPLLLLAVLCDVSKGDSVTSDAIADVIQRPDDMSELFAIRMKLTGKPMRDCHTHGMVKGLARAFGKFDEYSLAKNDKDSAEIRLRDVLRIVYPKPKDEEQSALWARLTNDELATPDTWEVALSAGGDKKEVFSRLLGEGKLGYMALLRNLRNMNQACVPHSLIKKAILARKGARRVLPFRYIAAARQAMEFEREIDQAMQAAISELPVLKGKTIILVDVSHSMNDSLSAKSDMTRMDAAAGLASIANAEHLQVFSFSANMVEVPPRRGMAGVDAIIKSQEHSSTYLGRAVSTINKIPHDRLIVITDEQSHDIVPNPVQKNSYMINVASNKVGIGYGKWIHLDGFSEAVLQFIHEYERTEALV